MRYVLIKTDDDNVTALVNTISSGGVGTVVDDNFSSIKPGDVVKCVTGGFRGSPKLSANRIVDSIDKRNTVTFIKVMQTQYI